MRNIKRTNPSLNCVLQYDKLVVDNKIFVWNDIQVDKHLVELSSNIREVFTVPGEGPYLGPLLVESACQYFNN